MIDTSVDIVFFITAELGKDLIISFAVMNPDYPSEVESLTLLRTPKYEFALDPHERGVFVSFERYRENDDRDQLKRVRIARTESIVELETTVRRYRLDVRKVGAKELANMRKGLHRMNFNGCFKLTD